MDTIFKTKEVKETDFSIDMSDLASELESIPTEVFFWGKKVADIKYERQKEETKLDIIMAELEGTIRNNPMDFGIQKITEATVKAALITQPTVKEQKDVCALLTRDMHIACSALDAVHAKKYALPDLVKLQLNNLYSEVVVDTNPSPRRKGEE